MLRIAVCDDDKIFLNRVKLYIDDSAKKLNFDASVTTFTSALPFLSAHINKNFDIVFLDIKMPDMDGITAAKRMRQIPSKTKLIFLTSMERTVYESFSFAPYNFIRKSIAVNIADRIYDVMKHIAYESNISRYITVPLPYGKVRKVYLKDILYIKSKSHYIEYVLYGKNNVIVRENISTTELKLAEYNFVRIHKSYIVNMSNIRFVDVLNSTVELYNLAKIKYGKAYENNFLNAYSEFSMQKPNM